jgi:hypothetical protein
MARLSVASQQNSLFHNALNRNSIRNALRPSFLFTSILFFLLPSQRIFSQEQPWEFDPYRIRVWLSIDPSIAASDAERQELERKVGEQLDIVFGASAEIDAQTTPRSLFSIILRELEDLAIPPILESEFVFVAGRDHPATKEIRTLESILKSPLAISVPPSNLDEVRREMSRFAEDSTWKSALEKLEPATASGAEFLQQLKDDKIPVALVRRSELNSLGRSVRFIPARFPWQLDSLLRTHDKIFAVAVNRESDLFRIRVREIDAKLRVVGPMVETEVPLWESVPRALAFASQQSFSPLARIEQADTRFADLRLRAGGLILDKSHPAKLVPGDVLQPFVRRDDRNGIPTLLQSVPWTYVALVESNGVMAKSAIFTGITSPLAGRKNRRTQKICMKVRPVNPLTELELGIMREPNGRISGAEVFLRTPGDTDLHFVDRGDWRGIAELTNGELPIAKYEVPAGPPTEDKKPPEMKKEQIQLNAPLYVYYVKHGGTLLARLPIVTGQSALERAELPDDRRRLESEAFVKGIQSEILDVVARRQILASRIKQMIEAKKGNEARKLLEELRDEKGYDKMVEGLNAIQRRVLSADRSPITPGAQKRIDQMFDLTRQMMQRYLQDNLLRDMDNAVNKL